MTDHEYMHEIRTSLIRIDRHLEKIDTSLNGPEGLQPRLLVAEQSIQSAKSHWRILFGGFVTIIFGWVMEKLHRP